MKSKSGKDRAKIKFKLTIPANPNFDSSTHASNLLAMKSQSFSTYSVAQSATPTPQKSPKVSSLFKRNRGSIRSNQSSGGDYSGSRQSLDSAGFETQGGARESSSRNSNLQECNNIFLHQRTIKNTIILYLNYLLILEQFDINAAKINPSVFYGCWDWKTQAKGFNRSVLSG